MEEEEAENQQDDMVVKQQTILQNYFLGSNLYDAIPFETFRDLFDKKYQYVDPKALVYLHQQLTRIEEVSPVSSNAA